MNKSLLILTLFLFNSGHSFCQPELLTQGWYERYLNDYGLSDKEYKTEYAYLDFAPLILKTPSYYIYGIIGNKMQRMQLKWLSIEKDTIDSSIYLAHGKTKVQENVVAFKGQLIIKNIRIFDEGKYDMPYKSKVNPTSIGVVFFDYTLREDSSKQHSGVFKGISATQFYIDGNSLYYNDLRYGADDLTNNEFVGVWTSYSDGKELICNWGDYRVPNVINFDCGAAQFAPCKEFAHYGWQDFDKGDSAKKSDWWMN